MLDCRVEGLTRISSLWATRNSGGLEGTLWA